MAMESTPSKIKVKLRYDLLWNLWLLNTPLSLGTDSNKTASLNIKLKPFWIKIKIFSTCKKFMLLIKLLAKWRNEKKMIIKKITE